MKKTITILCMLIGLTAFSQTNISSILADLQWDLRLGCCADDPDNHEDFPDCIFPEYQNYKVTGDVNINENLLYVANSDLTVTGDFYAVEGSVSFSPNCTSTITIEGNLIYTPGAIDIENQGLKVIGEMIEQTLSLTEYARNIKLNEPYIIYNSLGQMLKTGLYQGKQDLYATEFRIIKFPALKYSSKMIIKR